MAEESNKKIDGIRKINKEDLIKSRKIVLDSIGESTQAPSALPETGKKVDSLRLKEPSAAPAARPPAKAIFHRVSDRQKMRWQEEMAELMPEKGGVVIAQPQRYSVPTQKIEKQIDRLAPDFMKATAAANAKRPEVKIPPPPPPASPLKPLPAAKPATVQPPSAAVALKPLPAEKPKPAPTDMAARHIREKDLSEEIARKKLAQAEARKADKLKQQQKRRDFYAQIFKSLKELKIKSQIVIRSSFYILTITTVLIFLLYAILSIIELKFDLDNRALRALSRYFPVPAIITKTSLIEYYQYKNIIAQGSLSANAGSLASENIKFHIAKLITAAALKEKYRLSDIFLEDLSAEDKEKLSRQVVGDAEINQVGLERIKKIKQMIEENGDFVQIAGKYGDELGQVTITAENEKDYPYSAAVKNLAAGEVSDIVYAPTGYYIFRCYDKTADRLALSYTFVRAKTLDQYLEEAAREVKMWSLVK